MAWKLVAFILPLGLDTLAVSIALGLRGAPLLRVAVTFALFEGAMPLIGIAAASFVPRAWESIATTIGGLVLIGIGIHALIESRELDEEAEHLSFQSLRLALASGLSISLDELAIGFPLKLSGLPVGITLGAIAIQAFVLAAVGVAFGRRLGERFARSSAVIAGIAFIALGVALIAEQVHR